MSENGSKEKKLSSFMLDITSKIFNGEILNEAKLTSQLFTSFIVIGIVTHLFFSNVYSSYGNYGPATSLIWGYSIILFSMFSIMFLNQANDSASNLNLKMIQVDDIILMVLILWLISLNSKFSKKINTKTVPNNFYNYSFWSTILIALELVIFILKMTISNNGSLDLEHSMHTSNKTIMANINFISYLLLTLIFILIIIQQIILDNFSVDIL